VFNVLGTTSSNHPGGTNFNGTIGYTVDVTERLLQETSSRFGSYTENNEWDAAGNPTKYRNSAGKTYNGSNQRTNTGYTFDGNGNPTTYASTTATFDPENRLTAYTNGYQNTFGYRADGLRAWKQYISGGQAKKRYYLYDGGNPVLELDTSGNVVATNVYAPDGLVSRTWSGGNRYYLFDWQGNLAVTMDSSTNVRVGWAFNAWGQVNSVNPYTADSFWDDCFGYNARWGYIKETSMGGTYAGMCYCQNRFYDPANGRWLNRDPISYAGGVNLYGYCGGGPVGNADPWGTGWRSVLGSIAGGIVGGIVTGGNPLGMAAGAALLGGLGASADELDRQMDQGEEVDFNAAFTEGVRDAGVSFALGGVGGLAGKCLSPLLKARKIAKLTRLAQARYPKLAGKLQNHHIDPKYLGGAKDGPTVELDGAYHQLVTNEFRKEWSYGQGAPSREMAEDIAKRVYKKFPLPDAKPTPRLP
jgi:RHS repeat-associated protein